MVIQTFPPRRMCRVIAIRAASICLLVTYERSSAWMPYSPKATLVPPLALPCRSGRCCLRCAVLRGMSMPQPSSLVLAAGAAAVATAARGASSVDGGPPWAGPPWVAESPGRRRARAGGRRALGPGLRGLAAVDPDLHANPAEGGPGLVEAVVDVGAQSVQRDPALAVELRPRHLGAAEAPRALHPDPLGSALHRRLHRLAHSPPEGNPAGQLLGYALGHQLGVYLGVLYLEDVELDLLAGQLLQ